MTGIKQAGLVATVIAMGLLGWVIVKASIIGYYPDEVVPQLLIPGMIGAVFYGTSKLLMRD